MLRLTRHMSRDQGEDRNQHQLNSRPAELLTMAVKTKGVTKSSSSAAATRMTIAASRITAVALRRNSQSGGHQYDQLQHEKLTAPSPPLLGGIESAPAFQSLGIHVPGEELVCRD